MSQICGIRINAPYVEILSKTSLACLVSTTSPLYEYLHKGKSDLKKTLIDKNLSFIRSAE
jgi:hypothetical protein